MAVSQAGDMTTRERVRELTKAGSTPQEIAWALRCTTQNVYYHLERLYRDGELERTGEER